MNLQFTDTDSYRPPHHSIVKRLSKKTGYSKDVCKIFLKSLAEMMLEDLCTDEETGEFCLPDMFKMKKTVVLYWDKSKKPRKKIRVVFIPTGATKTHFDTLDLKCGHYDVNLDEYYPHMDKKERKKLAKKVEEMFADYRDEYKIKKTKVKK